LTADIPADATKEQKRDIVAAAVDFGLRHASASADFRLALILGEAWARFHHLVCWTAYQIAEDETKAPGLRAYAERIAPSSIDAGSMEIVKAALLRAALNHLSPITHPDAGQSQYIECPTITPPAIPGTG
jgi:hypothetical protein